MNIAEKYFHEQLSVAEFRHSYLEEKAKLDIEYQLEELKKDILSFSMSGFTLFSPIRTI